MAAEATHPAAGADAERPRWVRGDWIAVTLVLVWVAVCFAQTLGFGFVNWDEFKMHRD